MSVMSSRASPSPSTSNRVYLEGSPERKTHDSHFLTDKEYRYINDEANMVDETTSKRAMTPDIYNEI